MIRTDCMLFVVTEVASVQTDSSDLASSFAHDPLTLTQDVTDYLYLGYYKPISKAYLNVTSPQTTTTKLVLEYWNGTAWAACTNVHDDTRAYKRSGFIQWDRTYTDQTQSTVAGTLAYWYRLRPLALTTAATLAGIGCLFSDDNDLAKEFIYATDPTFLAGTTSHVLIHVAVRDFIIQRLRNQGQTKQGAGGTAELTPWDLLDTGEVNAAATYLALSKIMMRASVDGKDAWAQKSKWYQDQFEAQMPRDTLSIDQVDNGQTSGNVAQTARFSEITR